MTVLKRATLTLKRNFNRSLVLFFLIFLLSMFSIVSISVSQALYQTDANLRAQLPAVATLQWQFHQTSNDENDMISPQFPKYEMITKVGALPEVKDYDVTARTTFFSQSLEPVRFATIPNFIIPAFDTPDLADLQEPIINQLESLDIFIHDMGGYIEPFPVIGINNPTPTLEQLEIIELTSGRFMTDDELYVGANQAVISTLFAQINNLDIGSTFFLKNTVYDDAQMLNDGIMQNFLYWHLDTYIMGQDVIELEVIGIFDVNLEMLNIDHYTVVTMASLTTELYNTIFTPFELTKRSETKIFHYRQYNHNNVALLLDQHINLGTTIEHPLTLNVLFILHDPRDFNAFFNAANQFLSKEWSVVDTSNSFAPFQSSMDQILWISALIFRGSLSVSLIVLSLTITLFVIERKFEIGVYLALGEKKIKFISQILLELLLVASLAISLAFLAGNITSNQISNYFLETSLLSQVEADDTFEGFSKGTNWHLLMFDPGPMTTEEMLEAHDLSLGVADLIIFLSSSFVVIFSSTVIPIVYIMRLEPKEILLENNI